MSIKISDQTKKGKSECLFEKFQTLQEKIELKEQMIQLAKQKKTIFAKALLASAGSGKNMKQNIVS